MNDVNLNLRMLSDEIAKLKAAVMRLRTVMYVTMMIYGAFILLLLRR